jgi:hypothetical protein
MLGVGREWDGAECRPEKYPPRRIQGEEDGSAEAWRLPVFGKGKTSRLGRSVAFCRRAGRARGGLKRRIPQRFFGVRRGELNGGQAGRKSRVIRSLPCRVSWHGNLGGGA